MLQFPQVSIERQEFNKEYLREALENDKEMSQDSGDCFENLVYLQQSIVYLQQRRRYNQHFTQSAQYQVTLNIILMIHPHVAHQQHN